MGIPSDRRFLRAARRQLAHLFPRLPSQDALHKRRARLAETIEWLIGVFAAQSPGASDDLLLLDSTPVECGRSLDTARRSHLAEIGGYGYSQEPLALVLGHATASGLRTRRHPASGRAGRRRPARTRDRAQTAATSAPRRRNDRLRQGLRRPRVRRKPSPGSAPRSSVRPARTSPTRAIHLAPIRQRIESVFFTCKDLLTLERHGARTPRNLYARIATRLLALAACISLNHQLGRPSRAIADYTA